MLVGVAQTTWDLWGQIGVWLIGFPLLIGGLVTYIAVQIINERRENQRLEGRWGLSAKSRTSDE